MTITTYTDKEIALKAQLAATTLERDEYQRTSDKMAMEYKIERGALTAEVERLRVAARYAEHIDATPKNQRETMLYDAITEREGLAQRVKELEAAIEASQKQEAVAYEELSIKYANGTRLTYDVTPNLPCYAAVRPLYAAPGVADDVLKDAQRYRYIRAIGGESWTVLETQKRATNEAYDAATDAAMGGQQ